MLTAQLFWSAIAMYSIDRYEKPNLIWAHYGDLSQPHILMWCKQGKLSKNDLKLRVIPWVRTFWKSLPTKVKRSEHLVSVNSCLPILQKKNEKTYPTHGEVRKLTHLFNKCRFSLTRWWFQTFFIFTLTWGKDPIWRAYFSNRLKPPTSLVSPGICDPFQEGRSEYHNFPVTTHSLHSPHGTKIQRSNELVWLLPWLIGGQWLGPVIHGCLSCILWILVVLKFKTIMYILYMF